MSYAIVRHIDIGANNSGILWAIIPSGQNVVIKRGVTQDEYELSVVAAEHQIGPAIIDYIEIDGVRSMISERMEGSLDSLIMDLSLSVETLSTIYKQYIDLVLHALSIGFCVTDTHLGNAVYSFRNGAYRVLLIDFDPDCTFSRPVSQEDFLYIVDGLSRVTGDVTWQSLSEDHPMAANRIRAIASAFRTIMLNTLCSSMYGEHCARINRNFTVSP